ncbi:MAG: HEAT repeat domain-containing protein [Actinomycetota bacterium]|nr:HEAT repeat domain-containing protein [Actinomycetota bacterium]
MNVPDAALEAILRDLRSHEWAVRAQATRELGAFADEPRAVDALVAALYDAHNTAVTEAAAEELLRLATPRAVDALLAALASDDREVSQHVRDMIATKAMIDVTSEIPLLVSNRDG